MSFCGTVYEYKQRMEQGVVDYTCNGNCSNCGECCGDLLPLTERDIQLIRNYLAHHKVEECKHVPPTSKPVIDHTCPFRNDKERKCNIYPVRPTICRLFKCNDYVNGKVCDITKFKGKVDAYSMRSLFFGGKEE